MPTKKKERNKIQKIEEKRREKYRENSKKIQNKKCPPKEKKNPEKQKE